MESKSAPISVNDLTLGSKRLASAKTKEGPHSLGYDLDIAKQYAEMFDKYGGDVGKIFDKLNENARKAIKYPPKDAEEFGMKYAQGFYSCLTSEAKE